MPFPVIMTTYERTEYFINTVRSLEKSGHDLSQLMIYDDASQSIEKQAALASCGYQTMTASTNKGPYQSMIAGISWGFNKGTSEYLIYTQDDVEYYPQCFITAIELASMINNDGYRLGILSLYHRSKNTKDEPYRIMQVGHPGAICWLITRDFWDTFIKGNRAPAERFTPNDERKAHFVRNLADYKICRYAHQTGFAVAHPRLSLVQHVGDASSLSDRDMSFCRSTNYIGDVLNGQEK